MKNNWSNDRAQEFVSTHGPRFGEKLALRTYSSRLLGQEPGLVLHGGGNTSVKGQIDDIFGQPVEAVFVKASGIDLAQIEPDGHEALNLGALLRLESLDLLSPQAMVNQLRINLFAANAKTPSIEALMHAFLPHTFIDHTHPEAILTLSNQPDGAERIEAALGPQVIILEYIHPGFELAKAVAKAMVTLPTARGMVLMQHGLLTWGASARHSYETTIELVTLAEEAIRASRRHVRAKTTFTSPAQRPWIDLAPEIRGALAHPTGLPDNPFKRWIVRPLDDPETLTLLHQPGAEKLFVSGPITSDHIIRCKPWPLWIHDPSHIREAVQRYRNDYQDYFARHADTLMAGTEPCDPSPRVVLVPGVGGFIAGEDAHLADIARDITRQTLRVKDTIAAIGSFSGLDEKQLFSMDYFPLQRAKLKPHGNASLEGRVAVVTGAAGAIGSGICRRLLKEGTQVAATDLDGEPLASLVSELAATDNSRIIGVPMDVTDENSVAGGLDTIIRTWGGVDLVVINAGLAHVASLATLEMGKFRQLNRVNVEGTLLLLSNMARLFARQNTGGDIVLISTKNVFAPGANFGAYSATKAASHQLARIASLELASLDVRVNMVSPDAVFSDGKRKSGLWAEVGPDRMRARGLDEAGLENYYRDRNLLKAAVTADHVANAVLFFATRQTPTTGATLPVDGGLPDATPR